MGKEEGNGNKKGVRRVIGRLNRRSNKRGLRWWQRRTIVYSSSGED
jgi:hypothetical protein